MTQSRKYPTANQPATSCDQSVSSAWYVYMVQCADSTLYAGVTTHLKRRLGQHNGDGAGGARYTRARRPVRLVWWRACLDRSSAQKEEAWVRRLSRGQKWALVEAFDRDTPR
ncbi:MAG: GIY-YIG nuclease family protein [Halieaceae bacterium]|jgi:putative endonuclease